MTTFGYVRSSFCVLFQRFARKTFLVPPYLATSDMPRLLIPAVGFLLLVAASAPVVSAAATPNFYEGVVIEDTDGDFAAAGHLDIVALYVGEKFGFDPEKKVLKGNQVGFRLEVRDIGSFGVPFCGVEVMYRIQLKVDGVDKNATVHLTSPPGTDAKNCIATPGTGSTGPISLIGNSIVLTLPSESLGVVPGSVLSDFWAYSMASNGPLTGNAMAQDTAPGDNRNAPTGAPLAPSESLGSYTAVGVFPFITAVPLVPTEQFSVNGGEVEYAFQFFSHEQLSDDNIRVRFEIPDAWTLSPSRGTTGVDPEGQLAGGSGGTPVEFSFTTSATGIVNEGDVAAVVMHVITDAGGYQQVIATTTVAGPKISDPNLTFDLTSKGPFTAEESSTIRFSASHPTIDLAGQTLSIDVYSGTRRITTLTAKPVGGGVYEVVYAFPSDGEYRLDVYISSMKPSPHQEFTVSVEKGGLAPGPGFVTILLVALLGVAGYLRRNP